MGKALFFASLLGRTLDHPDSELIVLIACHDRVLHWVFPTDASWHRFQSFSPVKPKKERRRVPLLATLVHHTMHSRHKEIVGLSHETVGNIHHRRAGNWLCLYPVSCFFTEHLEPADFVLGYNGKTLHVRMCTDPILIVDGVDLGRVVQDAHSRLWTTGVLVEIRLWKTQGQGKDVREASYEVQELGVIGVQVPREKRARFDSN